MNTIYRQYIKHKRNKIGICNICQTEGNLTWDHVPPKGVLYDTSILTNTIFQGIPSENDYMKNYMSGIKYRTICKNCNNSILGENDKVYKSFIEDIIFQMNAIDSKNLYNPKSSQFIMVRVKINRLLRAICGHILAAKEEVDHTEIDIKLREYVLNPDLKPMGFNVFSWLYPYSTIVISRDFVVIGNTPITHPEGLCSFISAFPISFMVSNKDETGCLLDCLSLMATDYIDEIVNVPIHLDSVMVRNSSLSKHFLWPIDITDEAIGAAAVLGGETFTDDSRLGVRRSSFSNNSE